MQQSCTYGSVRGARGNRRPYRDKRYSVKASQPGQEAYVKHFRGVPYARIAGFLAFGHTSPQTYAEGTASSRFLIRTKL
jgi:hypothetical protein